jgi:hypothetical protein
MELSNYISKYWEKKIVLQRKYPTLCIISLYNMYVTTFYTKIIFHFPKKILFYVGNTTDWKVWRGATYLEIFFSWWFSRLHIMWICHCNVGKTNRLKQNWNENIWCHQNMNRKKCVYFDNDPNNNTMHLSERGFPQEFTENKNLKKIKWTINDIQVQKQKHPYLAPRASYLETGRATYLKSILIFIQGPESLCYTSEWSVNWK